MAPVRRSSRRISNKRADGKRKSTEVTPASSVVSKKHTTRSSILLSHTGAASSTDQQRSVTTSKPTRSSSRVLCNPYAKKPASELSSHGSSSVSEHSLSGDESSGNESLFTPPTAALPTILPSSVTSQLPAGETSVPLFQSNTTDGSIDFASIGAPANNEFTLFGILQSIADNGKLRIGPNILAEDIADLDCNTDGYEKARSSIVNRFFQVLVNHPQLYPLADMIPDPDNPLMMKRRLYILCRAPKAPNKKFILNRALIIFSMTYVKKAYIGMDLSKDPQLYADAQYEPVTAQTAFKMLFSRFAEESITYSQSKDFNGKGNSMSDDLLVREQHWCFVEFVHSFSFVVLISFPQANSKHTGLLS